MAHYAFLDKDNIVTKVIPGRNEDEIVDGISDWETYYGESFGQVCKRTSYNTHGGVNEVGIAFRKNFGAVGTKYDESLDAFIPIKIFDSWVLDEETCLWFPPFRMPDDGKEYTWSEEDTDWKEIVD